MGEESRLTIVLNKKGRMDGSMWKRLGFAVVVFILAVTGYPRGDGGLCSDRSVISEAKSFYVGTIHEDCRLLLEAIELFIQRDYPRFWLAIESGQPVERSTIDSYLRELRYFEKILDNLFREYTTFRREGASPDESASAIESQILQMLAYCYFRTGDLFFPLALQNKYGSLAESFSVQVRNVDGQLADINVTAALNRWVAVAKARVRLVKIQTSNFLPTDSEAKNVYCRISEGQSEDPLYTLYLGYYARFFPGLGDKNTGTIHYGEIVRYANRIKELGLIKEDGTFIPVVGGEVRFESNDKRVMVLRSAEKDVFKLEHLFLFKGYVDDMVAGPIDSTAVGNVKAEGTAGPSAAQSVERRLVLSAQLTQDGTTGRFQPGEHARYGIYNLFENDKYVGQVELVPCLRGENCPKASQFKRISKIDVYDHEFVLSKDLLDLVADNEKLYRAVNVTDAVAVDTPKDWKIVGRSPGDEKEERRDTKIQREDEIIHVFRGCATSSR